MQTMRDIKIRLKSIDSTRQITQSMRLISNRKVQKMKIRMQENRDYFEQSIKIIDGILSSPHSDLSEHVYITGREHEKDNAPPPLVIIITGDRGLCGGYNANAEREANNLMKRLGSDGAHIIAIGTKGRDYYRRRKKNIIKAYKGLSENPFYEDAQKIGGVAIEMFTGKTTDENGKEINSEMPAAGEVYLVYTQYNTMLSQTPKSMRLLPLDPDMLRDKLKDIKSKSKPGENADAGDGGAVPPEAMSYDSGEEAFFNHAVSSYISSALFGSMLESSTSEQCARLTGMDAAVKNSEKIIDALTLQYNQMRQGAITQEIAEIVGGANAVEK
jgi:F-type H+-transporting ATPase subunit gamma